MAHRYVFVAGLHRSGTSLLTRMLGSHPAIANIDGAPVPEDEGCYLQGGIPHTARHGVPGDYATDPAQHLTEDSRYNTLKVQQRIASDWSPWFDPDKPWRVEKSPVNLTRMRLYQQLFPMSQFVVIIRHPEAIAGATAKWSDKGGGELIDYALAAYVQAWEDISYLHNCLVLRYEDLVAKPAAYLEAICAFLGLAPLCSHPPLEDRNADYREAKVMSSAQCARATPFGYGANLAVHSFKTEIRHALRETRCAAERALP